MEILGSKTSKPEERAQAQSVEVVKQALSEIKDLQESVKSGQIKSTEFLLKTSELFTQSVEKFEEITTKAEAGNRELIEKISSVFIEIRDELALTRESFDAMELKPEIVNSFAVPEIKVPDITVPKAVIHNEIAPPDLTKLERLLTQFPAQLLQAIAKLELIPADELRDDIKQMLEYLKTISEKEWQANLYGGGGGGGNTPSVTNQGIYKVPVLSGGLVPENYNDLELGYTDGNLTSVRYLYNSEYVCTLTLTYLGSNLIRVTRIYEP